MASHRVDDRGFTLVELMVAVTLLGVVMTVIFALFSTTSDSLYEADSMADTLDRSRFALERVSADMRSAGSFASPDMPDDPWVQPKSQGGDAVLNVYGLLAYEDWQDNTDIIPSDSSVFPGDVLGAHTRGGDAQISFDGFVVMGAIDFPQTFEINSLTYEGSGGASPGRVKGGKIPENERGLFKLLLNDPFYTDVGEPDHLSASSNLEMLTQNLPYRLIRVMDRNGYLQFSAIEDDDSWSLDAGGAGLDFSLRTSWMVKHNSTDDSEGLETEYGLERQTIDDEDIGYDAALIDAYWYYVEQDPANPVNFRLVRQRLDALALATALATGGPTSIDSDDLAGTLSATDDDGDPLEKAVITDRVVDFQVWVDCADTNGNLTKSRSDWKTDWLAPKGDDCLEDTSDGDGSPGAARMAHIRLSLRTQHERRDNPDSTAAMFMDEAGNYDPTQPIRYFDMYPDAPGSARVVTVQNDIELTNFAVRNVRGPASD
jgi:prepilin-type N-terminal cleavage/methylation domain-containing protein